MFSFLGWFLVMWFYFIGGIDCVCFFGNEIFFVMGIMCVIGDWVYVKNGSMWFCGCRDW